ncbi:MAG: hypothetical protein M1814_004222 [Vezdaea aestivalis]|nr:MAG: hypothetical protein M1814_004222 [Vezdaea aestivalis]
MATRKALVFQSPGKATIESVEIPALKSDEILVRTRAVALNPTDWHHLDHLANTGSILGCDVAGDVEEVGAAVTKVKKGDRVAGFTHGGSRLDHRVGAFATSVIIKADVTVALPSSLSYESGSTLGVGVATIAQALYQHLSIPFPPGSYRHPILIYGGSTATGTLAVQFAALSGLDVLTTSSPHNFDLLRSLGASKTFDYHDADVAEQISAATGGKLALAFDTVSEGSSGKISINSLDKEKGGKYVHLKPVEDLPRGEAEGVKESMPIAYKVFGEKFMYGEWEVPVEEGTREFGAGVFELAGKLLAEGKLTTHPIKQYDGGLNKVLEGLADLKAGKVSGQKIVYTLG